MPDAKAPRIAIVDYGMGNLFSVKHACQYAGLNALITSSPKEVLAANAVILPGVGAFGDAMKVLRQHGLITVLQEVAASSKPLVGICLGMQLLMTESFEFGHHMGLGIIPGSVVRFDQPHGSQGVLKVPQICWNRLDRVTLSGPDPWAGSLLEGLPEGVFMYFVHSYHCRLEDSRLVLSQTQYGNIKFCSSLRYRNIFACQCHPERSGPHGLRVYINLSRLLGVWS